MNQALESYGDELIRKVFLNRKKTLKILFYKQELMLFVKKN